MKEFVNTKSYLCTSLTSIARYNLKLNNNLDNVNKLFEVTGEFHTVVDLNIFRTPYLDKFVRPNPEKFINDFFMLLKYSLFQMVITYKLDDGQIFTFEVKLDGLTYKRESRCYYIYKVI